MPGRDIPLVNGEIYHVFNRGVANQPIFLQKRDYQRFLDAVSYYQNKNVPIRYSKFLALSRIERNKMYDELFKKKDFFIEIICYCLMPNHFHLLLKQIDSGGISKFVGNLSNSYTRFFNTKNKRSGPLLQGKFKAIRIETDEQLLHVSRYIHLNPYTSFTVKNIEELTLYPYSSFGEYLKLHDTKIVSKDLISTHFKTFKLFREFTFNQAEYQKQLAKIKHLILEK